ncbi:MAG TPA: enoyl-CoA hydratase-related protein [Nitrospiraceae bacterium]|jgi:enoyl-CoA hydratase/carnithine racemase|nr:enoyl-CoA hydratase-related protein [Nitrospiraceae bacterium]
MPHQLLTISHHVARITLHHPPANVLNLSVLKELELVLNEVEEDEYVRVVIVTGTGRFFCAGADIHELAHLTTVHSGSEFALRGQSLFSRIERSEKLVLAAINGTCVGGGLELALACHIRVAAAGAMMGLPEIKLGLIPGFGGTQRLPRVVGASKAAEMILTGESLSAEEAFRIGLVSRVVPPHELVAQAEAIAALMTAYGKIAVEAALHAIRGGLDIPLSEGLAREAELFGQLCITPDKQKAVHVFLEKRQPRLAETDA